MELKKNMLVPAVGGVCGVIIVVLAVLLVQRLGDLSAARGEREDQARTLNDYYSQTPYPSDANRKVREADVVKLTETADAARALLAQGLVIPQGETPSQFVTRIGAAITALNERQKALRPKALGVSAKATEAEAPLDYGFGRYVVQGEMPVAGNVPRLATQFAAIEHMCSLLLDKGAMAITRVTRQPFDEVAAPVQEEAPRSSRRNRRSAEKVATPVAQGAAAVDPVLAADGVSRERYTVAFQARYNTLAEVMNALVQDPLFVVVTDVSIVRPQSLRTRVDDMVKKRQTLRAQALRRAERSGGDMKAVQSAQEVPLFGDASPAERLVTDPAHATPLEITLAFDVYAVPPLAKPDSGKEGK